MQVDSRRGELAIAVVLLAIAGFFLLGGLQMPAGTFAVPGPGIVPTILSAFLAVIAAALIVKILAGRVQTPSAPVTFGIFPVAVISLALTGVALALERAGFVITLSVFLFVMLRAFSRLGTVRSAIVAIAVVFAANWFFDSLLGVNLPRGPWSG